MAFDLDKFEEELEGCDEVVARKWGDKGREISADIDELIVMVRMYRILLRSMGVTVE